LGWTEGQTEGRTEVKQYTPLRWSGGITMAEKQTSTTRIDKTMPGKHISIYTSRIDKIYEKNTMRIDIETQGKLIITIRIDKKTSIKQ